MSIPSSSKDTGRYIQNVRIYTDELIPNCSRCFVMAGHHKTTKEMGWYAFCKKSAKIEKLGPYNTIHRLLRTLTLTKGCDTCEYNKSADRASYLSLLDNKITEEMKRTFGDDYVLSVVMSSLQNFVENRTYLDVIFKDRFRTRLFRSLPDDAVAIVDMTIPCQNEKGFAVKIQALAGMMDRINEKEIRNLVKDEYKRERLTGSLNLIEQITKECGTGYPRHIFSNLRNLMNLRNKLYPAHATSSEALTILRNFGIDEYPLSDWEKGWRKILDLCSNSLNDLVQIFKQIRFREV